MLDGEAVPARRLELGVPLDAEVDLVDVEPREAHEVPTRLLPLGRVVEAGGAEDEVESLPGLLGLRLQPQEPLDLGRAHARAREVLLHELCPRTVLHVGADLGTGVAEEVQFGSARKKEGKVFILRLYGSQRNDVICRHNKLESSNSAP